MPLRALVVDDAILFRRVMSDTLNAIPGVEVVGNAANGRMALEKIKTLRPDFLTLDIEMPEMDGLAVLEQLKRTACAVETIVVSAMSKRGGELTVRALANGAMDFIVKPEAASADLSRAALLRELTPVVRAISHRVEVRALLRNAPITAPLVAPCEKPCDLSQLTARMHRLSSSARPEMVLIGVSTGGPNALNRMLPLLPSDLGVPVLVVQHMPPVFTRALADDLNSKCALHVCEASDGDHPQPNHVYLAPGGKQMKLVPAFGGRSQIRITDDPPENNCRPAVDYLFRSVALDFPRRSMAVILTGMGSDGTLGLKLLKRQGCYVIAQDEATCVIYGMPKAAVDAGMTDAVLPLDDIASAITLAVRGRA